MSKASFFSKFSSFLKLPWVEISDFGVFLTKLLLDE